MNDFTIRVTPEILTSASADVSKKADCLKSVFLEMDAIMQRTSEYWTGDAADLHRALLKEQLPKMDTVISRFMEQADKLKQIAANYSGATQAAGTIIEGLPSDVII